jgi:hypothetical protein
VDDPIVGQVIRSRPAHCARTAALTTKLLSEGILNKPPAFVTKPKKKAKTDVDDGAQQWGQMYLDGVEAVKKRATLLRVVSSALRGPPGVVVVGYSSSSTLVESTPRLVLDELSATACGCTCGRGSRATCHRGM